MPTKKERKQARRQSRDRKVARRRRAVFRQKPAAPFQEPIPVPNDNIPAVPADELIPMPVWDDVFEEELDLLHPEPVPEQVPQMPANNIPVLYDLANNEPKAPKKAKAKEDHGDLSHEVEVVHALTAAGMAKPSEERYALNLARDEAVIQQVREANVADMIPVMGEFMATRLKYFCDHVDLDHPHTQPTLRDGFQADSEFNSTLREVMAFTTLPSGKEMPRVLALLRESFTKAKSMKDVRVAIYKPHARTLKTQEVRDEARSKKTCKEVAIKEWLDKARGWNDHPASFKSFTRMNDAHAADVAANNRKSKKMAELGMTALAGSFGKRNEIIASFLGEQYAGFTKIKMLDAAIILAKVHGAVHREDYRSVSYPRKAFAKSPFWIEADRLYPSRLMGTDLEPLKDETGEMLKEKKITTQACMVPDIFTFKPRAYPLHEFKAQRTDHVKEILAAVEAHPDMGGKSLFDQFWVIVPGVALALEMHEYPTKEGDKVWVVTKPDGTGEIYKSAADAERALDFRLTHDGCIKPALLGEKDGKCYFITLWS